MEKITYKNPFDNMKKISLDVNEEILKIIDELVKLTKTSRTTVIGSIIGKGLSPTFRYFEMEWQRMLNEKTFNETKKKLIKKKLQDLKKIEITMWDPDHYKK
jgi:hypothetical protein